MIEFKGWVRSSLLDYPGRIAAVLFAGGCNFRCPMCHNQELVVGSQALPSLAAGDVLAFLERRAGKLTGVVVSGGEPTLQPDLDPFLQRVRELGYAVKLDTNGSRPEVLDRLLEARLLDAVALDVKAPPEKYPALAGVPDADPDLVGASMALIAAAGIPCEFRTTVVPGLLDADDVEKVAQWIAQAAPGPFSWYVVQQFRGARTLSPALTGAIPYQASELQAMADRARRWMGDVRLRGV